MENLSKPLALSNLIPVPLEKWHVDKDEFEGYLQVTKDHEFKYNVSAKYGTGRYPKNGTPFLKSVNNTSSLAAAQIPPAARRVLNVSASDYSS